VRLRLAGQNVVALFRDRVALSPGETALPSRPISNEPISSTAEAASELSLLRVSWRHDGMTDLQLIVNHFPT
jgi:hypothetical protein